MPLIILGVVAVLLIVLQEYCYTRLWEKGLDYKLRFSAAEAFEGDTLFLNEELVNKKFLPLPLVYAKMKVSEHIEFINKNGEPISRDGMLGSLFSIMMYTATRRKRAFVCKKRGAYKISHTKVTISNLLHTRLYNKELDIHSELLVFPKPLDDFEEISLLYKNLDTAVLTNRIINPDPFEFRGIRDYQPNDALKSINFRATAISQTLMVNIHAPTCAQRMMLVLNLEPFELQSDFAIYEQSIRLCATLAEHYIGMDVGVGFVTNGKDGATALPLSVPMGTSGGHLYKMYEALARISLSFKSPPMAEYVNDLTDREQMYVFVSPYHGDDFMDAFNSLESRGIAAFLIVPTSRRLKTTVAASSKTAIWNVV